MVFKENRKVRPWARVARVHAGVGLPETHAQVEPRDIFSMKETQELAQALDAYTSMTGKVLPVGDANTLYAAPNAVPANACILRARALDLRELMISIVCARPRSWQQVASRKWIDIMNTIAGGTTWTGHASPTPVDLNKH